MELNDGNNMKPSLNHHNRPTVHDHQSSSFNFLYNYNFNRYQGMDVTYPTRDTKQQQQQQQQQHQQQKQELVMAAVGKTSYANILDKKKRMSMEQLDSLEMSFQEEIKLDPDRKMKLARDLGLQPRQVAVWFQNRRARWKNKHLEQLYDSLKHDFDVVTQEKLKLQDEVRKLRAILEEQAVMAKNLMSAAAYTELSGEDTVESTSVAILGSNKARPGNVMQQHQIIARECNYLYNVDDYNPVSTLYWGAPMLPSHP